jgi:hypothetical protein
MMSAMIVVASSSRPRRDSSDSSIPGSSRSNRIAPSTKLIARTMPFPSNAFSTVPLRHSSPGARTTLRTTGRPARSPNNTMELGVSRIVVTSTPHDSTRSPMRFRSAASTMV